MSVRGDIVRAAGGNLVRHNKLGVGKGHPAGGDEGDIRVQMVNNQPRLCWQLQRILLVAKLYLMLVILERILVLE